MSNNSLFTKRSISDGLGGGLKAWENYCKMFGIGIEDVLDVIKFGDICYDVVNDDRRLYLRNSFFDLYFYYETKRRESTLSPQELKNAIVPAAPYEFLCRVAPIMVNADEVGRRADKGVFFQPFGIARDGVFSDRCRSAVSFTRNMLSYLSRYGTDAELIVMPADAYAIEVNGCPKDVVDRFVSDMKGFCGRILKPKVRVVEWSKIREENKGRYEELAGKFCVDDETMKKLIERASRFSNLPAEDSANRYASERFAEAIIVDETLKPIKISAANTDVDALDGDLPRIYPTKITRFPWLPSKWND